MILLLANLIVNGGTFCFIQMFGNQIISYQLEESDHASKCYKANGQYKMPFNAGSAQ